MQRGRQPHLTALRPGAAVSCLLHPVPCGVSPGELRWGPRHPQVTPQTKPSVCLEGTLIGAPETRLELRVPAQGVGAEGFFTLADVPSSRGRRSPHSASNSQIRGPCPHPNRKTKTSPRLPGSESLRNGGLSGMRPQRQRPQHPLAGGLGRAGPSGLSVLISCRGSVSGQAGCEDRMAAPGKARRPAGLMLSPQTRGPGSQATGLWVVQDSN